MFSLRYSTSYLSWFGSWYFPILHIKFCLVVEIISLRFFKHKLVQTKAILCPVWTSLQKPRNKCMYNRAFQNFLNYSYNQGDMSTEPAWLAQPNFQVGQARLIWCINLKLSIWLQFRIFNQYGIETFWLDRQANLRGCERA